jgi:hypothetical protein
MQCIHLLSLIAVVAVFAVDSSFANLEFGDLSDSDTTSFGDSLTLGESLWMKDPMENSISNYLTSASPETEDLFSTTDPHSWEPGLPDESDILSSTDLFFLEPGLPDESTNPHFPDPGLSDGSDVFSSVHLNSWESGLLNHPEISSNLLANTADDCDFMSQSKARRSAMCIDKDDQPLAESTYRTVANRRQDLAELDKQHCRDVLPYLICSSTDPEDATYFVELFSWVLENSIHGEVQYFHFLCNT